MGTSSQAGWTTDHGLDYIVEEETPGATTSRSIVGDFGLCVGLQDVEVRWLDLQGEKPSSFQLRRSNGLQAHGDSLEGHVCEVP